MGGLWKREEGRERGGCSKRLVAKTWTHFKKKNMLNPNQWGSCSNGIRGGGASTDPVSKPGQKKKNGILAKNPVWKKKKKNGICQFWEKIDFFWYLARASESDQKWPHEQSDPVTARTRFN